jgi:hypothetical protein
MPFTRNRFLERATLALGGASGSGSHPLDPPP